MNEEKNQLNFKGESRCPECRKLLSKPMVRITCISITSERLYKLIREREIEISFGSQSPCKRCRKLRETEEIAKIA